MIVLGISTYGQNPAAALIVDGKLIAFAEEERFIRIKGANGKFPSKSISYCLGEAKITLEEVDKFAIGWDANKYTFKMPLIAATLWINHSIGKSSVNDTAIHELALWRPGNVKTKMYYELKNLGLKSRLPSLEFVPHHLAHAASAYYASGFPDATILVLDGSGEERATTVYEGKGKTIHELWHQNVPDSLGWFYAATTAYLGFKPYEDDGFVMGLAPYGKPTDEYTEKVNSIVKLDNEGKYFINPQYTLLGPHSVNEHFSDLYVKLFDSPRIPGQPMTLRHKNVAFAIQAKLEQIMLTIAQRSIIKTGIANICLAGGVALNCKANGVISQSPLVDQIFVQPASHDAGTALGAAMVVAMDNDDDPRFPMTHARWGPSFSNDSIQTVLNEASISYSKPKNIEETIAKAITKGKIVARFAGRMEAGPRALGGRSILADATRVGMNDIVNNRVKHRDPWRPFCPSMIKEASTGYIVKPKEDRFMTVIYDVPKKKQKSIPSVVHVDGTTRPQVVEKSVDPAYYTVIKKVGEHIGIPAVLNTSFNIKGEPIVCTPTDALRCFYSTGIDALAIEGFWLEKK